MNTPPNTPKIVEIERVHETPLLQTVAPAQARPLTVTLCSGKLKEHRKKSWTLSALIENHPMVSSFFYCFALAAFLLAGIFYFAGILYFVRSAVECFCIISFIIFGWIWLNFVKKEIDQIQLSEEGVTFQTTGKRVHRVANIPWKDLVEVTQGKMTDVANEHVLLAPAEYGIVFYFRGIPGREANAQIGIPYSQLESQEHWRTLRDGIKAFKPDVYISPALDSRFPPDVKDPSYTELWLESLLSAPRRKRVESLSEKTKLGKGRFEVLCRLGSGGQGTAYLCAVCSPTNPDLPLQSNVVLKEYLLPVFVDVASRRTAVEQFEHEARLLANLDHPHIVHLLDYFIEDQRAYLVLEYVHGQNLKQTIEKEGPMDADSVHDLALKMCEILKYLHGLTPALVHCDFTPDNLILEGSGDLKLIDFMTTRAPSQDTYMSATAIGKQCYMPSEQLQGNASEISDIYALGCTLYYLSTGQDPHPFATSDVWSVREEFSQVLRQVILKATAFEPKDRYVSVEEITADLQNLAYDAG